FGLDALFPIRRSLPLVRAIRGLSRWRSSCRPRSVAIYSLDPGDLVRRDPRAHVSVFRRRIVRVVESPGARVLLDHSRSSRSTAGQRIFSPLAELPPRAKLLGPAEEPPDRDRLAVIRHHDPREIAKTQVQLG